MKAADVFPDTLGEQAGGVPAADEVSRKIRAFFGAMAKAGEATRKPQEKP